jgi:hypothetical protein
MNVVPAFDGSQKCVVGVAQATAATPPHLVVSWSQQAAVVHPVEAQLIDAALVFDLYPA